LEVDHTLRKEKESMMLKYFYLLSAAILVIVVSLGCEIEAFPDSLTGGSIHVTAFDDEGISIEQASIFIDGIERQEKTPAYIHGIDEGFHDVIVQKFGFWSDTSNVEVLIGDTVTTTTQLEAIPTTGFLIVTSDPSGARLLVNGSTFLIDGEVVTTPNTVELPWTDYDISVHMEGFATISPLLPRITISPGDTSDIAFALESGDIGGAAGLLPYDFILENEVADSIRLSDLTGQVVLLNFWYADCVPCIREFPYIEAVYRKYGSQGFHVLAIDPMFPDDREVIMRVREEMGLTFQLLLDWDRNVSVTLYNVNPYPRNILVDRTGRITEVLQGVEEDELSAMVEALIGDGS